jgi:tetratricopeptide (TPR) repeat protein
MHLFWVEIGRNSSKQAVDLCGYGEAPPPYSPGEILWKSEEFRRRQRAWQGDADAGSTRPWVWSLFRALGDFIAAIYGLKINGEIHEAAREWKQAAEIMPFNPITFFFEGECMVMDRDFTAARQAYSQAVALDPQLVEGWFALGNLDAVEGKEEEALKEYRVAEELQPDNSQTRVAIGAALAKLKRVDESLQYPQRAIRINDDDWMAHYALGNVFFGQDRVAEAREQFQQVVRLNPGHAKGHLALGAALVNLNGSQAAREQFEEVLHLEPDNQLARTYLSTLLR